MRIEDLLKLLATIGIVATSTSCEKDDNSETLLLDSKEKINVKNSTFTPFTPIAEIDLPISIQNEIIAIGKLSHDVFNNPSIANSFKNNPQEYLMSIGLSNVTLDTNSVEVKTALAMGDIDVRSAIAKNDIELFVQVLEDKGYLNYANMQIDSDLELFLLGRAKNDPEFQSILDSIGTDVETLSKSAIFVAVVWIYVGVVQDLAVGFNVGVGLNAAFWVNLEYWLNIHQEVNTYSDSQTDSSYSTGLNQDINTGGSGFDVDIQIESNVNTQISSDINHDVDFSTVYYYSSDTDLNYLTYIDAQNDSSFQSSYAFEFDFETHLSITGIAKSIGISDVKSNIITKNPVLKIWGKETGTNDTYILNEIIEKHVENLAKMIESTSAYKNAPEKILPVELRNLLRKPVTQKFIDLDLL